MIQSTTLVICVQFSLLLINFVHILGFQVKILFTVFILSLQKSKYSVFNITANF